jgi:hypothetical protein
MSYGSNEQFAQELGMYRGMSGGAQVPPQRLDFNFGDAGMGGAFGGLAPLFLQPMINSMFGHGGIMPAQFSPMQGFYDQWRAKQYWQAHQAALSTAAQADRETYVQMLRGMAQMRGTPPGLEQQRAFNVMAGDIAFMAPFLAQAMPETFDAMHGLRGSATVMASFLHRGGLTGVDPATGRTGLTGDSSGILAAEMHRRFFGVNADLGGWRGMSAGRAGALYDELQTRGLMGLPIGAMARDEQVGRLSAANMGTVDTLQKLQPTQFDALLRQFDANQIGNRLKEMSGAVAAMREIFGDLGRPNAPMRDLIEGLNKLTQGGLATMNPAELERTVRTTQVVARTSGMGMQAFAGLMAQGAALTQQLGLDPRFNAPISQGAAEFGAAYGQVGRGDLGGWGRGSRDEMILINQQQLANAASSQMSNQLGAAMRLAANQGGQARGPLANMVEAVRAGRNTFINERGQEETLNMNEGRFMMLMDQSGIGTNMARAALRGNNQEQIARFGIQNIVRQSQGDDYRALISQSFMEATLGGLGDVGVGGERGYNIARGVAMAQAQALTAMPAEVKYNEAARTQALADATRQALIANGMSEAEVNRRFSPAALRTMAAGGYGLAVKRFDDPDIGIGLVKALGTIDPTTMAREQFARRENAAEVTLRTAMGGLATAGPLTRAMEEILHPSATAGDALKKFLGGVDPADIRARLANIPVGEVGTVTSQQRLGILMQELGESTREYERTKPAGTPEQRVAQTEAHAAWVAALRQGGTTARDQIRTELVAAGKIKANASDAAVMRAAQQALTGPDEQLRRRIETLRTAGGMVDVEQIRQGQRKIMADAGMSTADIDKAMAGDRGVTMPAGVRAAVETMGALAGGIDAQAAASGVNVGAKVSRADLEDLGQQRKLLSGDIAENALLGTGNVADRRRHAKIVLERGRRQVDLLAGDLASVENLGAGGGGMVMRAYENRETMQALADQHGLNLAEVISNSVKDEDKLPKETREAIQKIRGLSAQVGRDEEKMAIQMGRDPSKRGQMTEAQRKAFTDWQAKHLGTDDERNKALITRAAAGLTGGSPEQEAALAQTLGSGPKADVLRRGLEGMVKARDALQAISATTGASLASLRGSGDPKIKALVASAGALAEGKTIESVRGAIEQAGERGKTAIDAADKAAGAAGGGKTKIEGFVTLRQDGTLDMGGSTLTGLNTTPVVT